MIDSQVKYLFCLIRHLHRGSSLGLLWVDKLSLLHLHQFIYLHRGTSLDFTFGGRLSVLHLCQFIYLCRFFLLVHKVGDHSEILLVSILWLKHNFDFCNKNLDHFLSLLQGKKEIATLPVNITITGFHRFTEYVLSTQCEYLISLCFKNLSPLPS